MSILYSGLTKETHQTEEDPFTMRDLALRFARAFEGFGLSTSMTSPR